MIEIDGEGRGKPNAFDPFTLHKDVIRSFKVVVAHREKRVTSDASP
jgi:hypothetical protein